jgi:uncharacterized protein (TIGR02246 family)
MARTPDEFDAEWMEEFNAGNGEAVLALYEPGAAFVLPTGEVVEGAETIGQVLGGFLAMKPRIDLRTKQIVRAGDTALVYSTWTLSATAPDGTALEMSGEPAVVIRQQADGTWRLLIDDPGWSAQSVELFKAMSG